MEVGAGTGEHARFFLQHLEFKHWTSTDLAERLPDIIARQADQLGSRLALAKEYQAGVTGWPCRKIDTVFSANTLHIMSWQSVENLLSDVSGHLPAEGRFVVYGPFHRLNKPNSDSNAQFDKSLRAQGTGMGIRSMESVISVAMQVGLDLTRVLAMPANNFVLVFRKTA